MDGCQVAMPFPIAVWGMEALRDEDCRPGRKACCVEYCRYGSGQPNETGVCLPSNKNLRNSNVENILMEEEDRGELSQVRPRMLQHTEYSVPELLAACISL